ncbi:unnamed protein product, partial [Didymodactylos carnosus]
DRDLNVWKISMKTKDDSSNDIKQYIKSIKQELGQFTPSILFGRLLFIQLGQLEKAEQYFRMLLKTVPESDEDYASAINNLGHIYRERNQFNLALEMYTYAYELRQKQLPEDHHYIGACLNNIGAIFKDKREYAKALDCSHTALKIYDK